VPNLGSTRPAVPATKTCLVTLSHAMERAFDRTEQPPSTPALVVALFQRREYFDVEAARYAALAAAGTCVVVGFTGSTQGVPPGVHAVGFAAEDPRSKIWVLIAVKGSYASSLVAEDARDLAPGELSLEAARLFQARWTFQRQQALADAHLQLQTLGEDLPEDVRSKMAAAIDESGSRPVSSVEAGLGAAIDHVLTSLEASYTRSSRLRASLESVQAQAERDALTGLRNRHFLERFLGSGDRPIDLMTMLVDVDDLKYVNDTHGHAAGDALLKAVADTLQANTRPGDVIIRWGGDEFLLLVPNLGPADGSRYAARIADAVRAARPAIPWHELPLSVSIGACPTRRTPLPLHQLDQALWRSKRSGKGRATYMTLEEEAS
jgi:diguanylate cyclase (GGDEF)-like protein